MNCGNCGACAECGNEDLPDVEELLQDEPDHGAQAPVPVTVVGPVRTEELPTTNGGAQHLIVKAGAAAQQLVPPDPRRKCIIVWAFAVAAGADTLCMALTRGEADAFTGPMFFVAGAVPVRYELHGANAWWVKGADMNVTGSAFTGWSVSTADIVLSYVVENWAR